MGVDWGLGLGLTEAPLMMGLRGQGEAPAASGTSPANTDKAYSPAEYQGGAGYNSLGLGGMSLGAGGQAPAHNTGGGSLGLGSVTSFGNWAPGMLGGEGGADQGMGFGGVPLGTMPQTAGMWSPPSGSSSGASASSSQQPSGGQGR